jgi:cytochrome b
VEAGEPAGKIRLWDLPVRLVHWSFVLLMPSLWWSWRSGDLGLHRQLGYVMLALILFRIIWGFAGSSTARFAHFVKGPLAVTRYLSGRDRTPVVGHNPVGGWSVLLLLSLLLVELGLGLFAQDIDGIESGPLTQYVSYEFAEAARLWHALLFDVLLGAVALHVAAILFYLLIRRDNLIGPMVTGDMTVESMPRREPSFAPAWRALAAGSVAAVITWWISLGAPH